MTSFWNPFKSDDNTSKEGKTGFRLPAARRKKLVKELLNDDGEIKLCWARSGEGTSGYTNLGDGLSAFMIANLAGLPVRHTGFRADTTKLVGVGSVGHGVKHGHAVIWGTGCYRPDLLKENIGDTTYDVLAVRGDISQRCLESVGIAAPHCYGEPVWLLPSMFREKVEKKYELGIITHISDLKVQSPEVDVKDEYVAFQVSEGHASTVKVMNTWHPCDLNGMLDKIRLILSCKRIASRSFHGVVIAEAFGIPCLPISSSPAIPPGVFTVDQVKPEMVDKRALEFFNCAKRRPQYFYGQRRVAPTDWDALIREIDRVWAPLEYDSTPMLEAFPFDIPVDPTNNAVPIHPSLSKFTF